MADTKTTTTRPASTTANNKPEDLKQAETTESKEQTEKIQEQEPIPSLKDDYELLKNMNLLRNVMIRAQYGRFPDKRIDGVLKRRMDLDESKFQGPKIVRAIISILALFLFCAVLYAIIYLSAKGLNLNGVADTASLVISLFFLSGLGFVIFNNFSVPDEKKLKTLINERMTEIEVELKVEEKNVSNANPTNTDKQKK